MDRKAFHQLLKKYVDGKCTGAEKQLIDNWYQLLDDSALSINEKEMDGIEEKLWKKIQSSIQTNNKKAGSKTYSLIAKISVAAAVFGLMYLGVQYFTQIKYEKNVLPETIAGKGFQKIENKTAVVKNVLLEDGSLVSLQPNASISFPAKFAANKREVYLQGVAYFKVSKNAQRPFYVYDDNIVTQVLGTSFIIKKVDNKIEVDVLTGRVAVYENNNSKKQNDKANGVVITPNQKVVYYTGNRQFVTALVENPVPVPVENKKEVAVSFLYDDALVSKVLADLQEQYKIQIITENENINHCYFTGDITEQSLYNKLDLLCQAINANYEVRGTSIVIDGKGCSE